MYDLNIIRKIVHTQSGKEFDTGFIEEATFVETLDLDGPKLMLTVADQFAYLNDNLKVRELDTLTCTLSDTFGRGGMNAMPTFTIVTFKTSGYFIKYELMATPVFETKNPVKDKSRAFVQRKVDDIISAYIKGVGMDIKSFPIVEDYHCLTGERPSILLRQIALEKGALIWVDRDTCHFKPFSDLWSQEPAFTYHHNKPDEPNIILDHIVPSTKKRLLDNIPRGYSGWDFTSSAGKLGGGGAPVTTASGKSLTLSNKRKGVMEVIDFLCPGNGALRPGQVLKLMWHLPDPGRPLNEELPNKVVVSAVGHHYTSQKYFCRVRGAVELDGQA